MALVIPLQGPAVMAAPTSISMPIKTTAGDTIGTYTMTMTIRETDVVGLIPSTSVSLPAGTYQLLTCAAAIPATIATASPCPITKEVTGPGPRSTLTGWVYPTRSLDGADETIAGWINVKVWTGTTWALYASSWKGLADSSLTVPPVGPPVPGQLFGTNSLAIRQEQWIDLAAEETEMDKLEAAGADLIRTNLPWAYLETNRDYWDPNALAFFDQYFSMALSHGFKVIATFGTTPCWALSEDDQEESGCTTPQTPTGFPPADYDDLTEATTFVTQRWHTALYAIEVGNEPNLDPPGPPLPKPAPEYAAMVRTEWDAIQAVNASIEPDVLVGAGVLAAADKAYLGSLYANGIQGHYDAISVHPYNVDFNANPFVTGSPLTPFSVYSTKYSFDLGVMDLHAFMLSKNDTSPMWITEFGFSTCEPPPGLLCVSEEDQAQWLTESFRMAARWPFVEVVMSFNGRDNDANVSSWNNNFGLMNFNLSAKTSLGAVTQTWACLRAATC